MKKAKIRNKPLKTPGSLRDLRAVLEATNPEFKRIADERRHAEARVNHLRVALKRTRVEKHIGQTDLAKRMGTTQSSISAFERGSGDLGMITMIRYLEGLHEDPVSWLEAHAQELAD